MFMNVFEKKQFLCRNNFDRSHITYLLIDVATRVISRHNRIVIVPGSNLCSSGWKLEVDRDSIIIYWLRIIIPKVFFILKYGLLRY